MSKILFVVFNGPPGSGKTELAKNLAIELRQADVVTISDAFAAPLKHFFAVALGDRYHAMDKERARPELSGYSLRSCLIDLSQNYMKERYGQDVFGRWLLHRALRYPEGKPEVVIIDDGGFAEETEALPNRYVVRVFRDGKSFTGDSRTYLDEYDFELHNNGDMSDLWKAAKDLCQAVLEWRRR